jgi:hypothetical protein
MMKEKENIMITRKFLSDLNFSVMTSWERNGFAGCQSPVPLIAENDQFLVVIDGNYCEVYNADAGDGTFEPIETCDDINALPY